MSSLVARNFSRSSRTYSAAGKFQRFAAGKLYDFIKREMPDRSKVGQVLEMGCGTGFLTIGLLDLFPGARFVVSDISDEMLRQCIDNTFDLLEERRIDSCFQCYNIAEAQIENYYDVVISALAFQWIREMEPVMRNIREHLHADGRLVFSTLLDGTFSLLHRAFADIGEEYPGPKLLNEEQLRQVCAGFNSCRIEVCSFTETYSSARSFLERIQLTGAGNPTGKTVSVGAMRRLMARCDELAGGTLTAEYQLANVICG